MHRVYIGYPKRKIPYPFPYIYYYIYFYMYYYYYLFFLWYFLSCKMRVTETILLRN